MQALQLSCSWLTVALLKCALKGKGAQGTAQHALFILHSTQAPSPAMQAPDLCADNASGENCSTTLDMRAFQSFSYQPHLCARGLVVLVQLVREDGSAPVLRHVDVTLLASGVLGVVGHAARDLGVCHVQLQGTSTHGCGTQHSIVL